MTAKLSLIGRRFGRLCVVSAADSDRFGKSRWQCLCDCGSTAIVGGRLLKTGHTQSCGCYRTERRKTYCPPHNRKPVDLSGQRFGYLVVLELLDTRSPSHKPIFKCHCDCGVIVMVLGVSLKNGNTLSCGCRKADLARQRRISAAEAWVGRRQGRWAVLKYLSDEDRFECLCECGTIKAVMPGDLKNGQSSSCGCYRTERVADSCLVDLTAKRSGKLVALYRSGSVRSRSRSYVVWTCRCDCGNLKEVRAETFSSGLIISCGCERFVSKKDRPVYMQEGVRQKSAARQNARRALKLKAGGAFTADQIDALYRAQKGGCASCGVKLGQRFHRDHVVPLARGGSNGIDNIQLLCASCNSRKGAKDPIQWAREQGRLL